VRKCDIYTIEKIIKQDNFTHAFKDAMKNPYLVVLENVFTLSQYHSNLIILLLCKNNVDAFEFNWYCPTTLQQFDSFNSLIKYKQERSIVFGKESLQMLYQIKLLTYKQKYLIKKNETINNRNFKEFEEELDNKMDEEMDEEPDEELDSKIDEEFEELPSLTDDFWKDVPTMIKLDDKQPANMIRENECIICVSHKKCIAFVPCGHIATCENCAKMIYDQKCPICRSNIQMNLKIFDV
jgi:hypothetical protein